MNRREALPPFLAADTLKLPADRTAFERLAPWLEARLTAWKLPLRSVQHLLITADEIFTNVASYAYPEGGGEVELLLSLHDGKVSLSFTDCGIACNPLEQPPPDLDSPLEERRIGGLGIFMIRQLTDFQSYERRDGKNVLTVEKKFTPPDPELP